MRIRTIKPEFWADEQIASYPPMSRLTYIGCWNEADDEGRLRANANYLRSRLFPYDADVDMAALLRPLIEAGKLRLYEVDGQTYGYLPRFHNHQVINRPSPSRLPAPPDSVITHGGLTEDSQQEGKGTGKGKEQGIRSKETLEAFEKFFASYPAMCPRKHRQPALQSFIRHVNGRHGEMMPVILAALRTQSQSREWTKNSGEFIPAPAVWLNQHRWETPTQSSGQNHAGGF